jgi:hypothetical protein
MRHASCQLWAWLIFDVRRDERVYSAACGEDGYMSASVHAGTCGVRALLLHSREGISPRVSGESWKYAPRCESPVCDRDVAVSSFDVANSSVSSAKSSEVSGVRTRESHTFWDLGRKRCVA